MNPRHPGRPRRQEWPMCKAETCERSTKGGSKGFCHAHYIANRRGFLLSTGIWVNPKGRHQQVRSIGNCLVVKCGKSPTALSLCNKHYLQLQAGIIDHQGNTLRGFKKRPRKAQWIGQEGYILVPAPENHPYSRVDGSILEHRLVMEKTLGRYLKEWEIVHHRNGNRSDNRIENLELMDGRAKSGGPGHPPAHDLDKAAALQVLLQQQDISDDLRAHLTHYRGF